MEVTIKMLRKIDFPFPEWRVVRELGSGSFGSVFCMEKRSGETCALKVIPVPSLDVEADDALEINNGDVEQSRKCFDGQLHQILTREIETAMSCRSCDNIYDVYESHVVCDPENPVLRYILVRMELLNELKPWFSQPGRQRRDVLYMMRSIANALVDLERRSIIHRDIKPANIMVSDGGVYKLTDFGEARMSQADRGMTVSRGTPYYMAPEVAKSDKYDCRADIYSLGIVGYYFLNGMRYPFQKAGIRSVEAYECRMSGEACPKIEGLDDRINAILLRCVAFRREQRYGSATELLNDLDALLKDKRIGQESLTIGRTGSASQSGDKAPSLFFEDDGSLSNTAIALIVTGVVLVILMTVFIVAAVMMNQTRVGTDGEALAAQIEALISRLKA